MDTAERREKIRQLKLDGRSHADIAHQTGATLTTVRADIRALYSAGELDALRRDKPAQKRQKSVRRPPSERAAAHPNATNRAELATLRAQAFDLAVQGMSHREIGEKLNRNRGIIATWIQTEIDELIVHKVEQYRKVQLARLESYLVALKPRIDRGDEKAINAAIRIAERISKLFGLDAPVKVDATMHEVDQADVELTEMVNSAKAKMAAEEQALRHQANADRNPDTAGQ